MTHPTVVEYAQGYNQISSLTIFPVIKGTNYVPVMPGLLYAVNRFAFNRARQDDGRKTYLKYPKIAPEDFYALNSFLGFNPLSSVNTVESTWNLKVDFNGVWHYFNGVVGYIINGTQTQRGYVMWMNVQYDITGLIDLGV